VSGPRARWPWGTGVQIRVLLEMNPREYRVHLHISTAERVNEVQKRARATWEDGRIWEDGFSPLYPFFPLLLYTYTEKLHRLGPCDPPTSSHPPILKPENGQPDTHDQHLRARSNTRPSTDPDTAARD
jgi:hypothetical protein